MGSLMLLGPTMDPRVAFDISMRLPHLGIRIKEHGRRAAVFAERLAGMGMDVIYPGLPDHPDHAILDRLRNEGYGFGGILGIDVGSWKNAERFMEMLQNEDRFGFMAVSLGYFDTLMSASAQTTSSELTVEEQEAAGIRPGLVRMSVGYTGSLEQRWTQLEAAINALELAELKV
jgi:methionine-gamma-lyase